MAAGTHVQATVEQGVHKAMWDDTMTHNRHLLGDALPGFLMCLRVAGLPCAGGCDNDMLIGLSISGEFEGSGTSLQVDVSGIEWRPGGPA